MPDDEYPRLGAAAPADNNANADTRSKPDATTAADDAVVGQADGDKSLEQIVDRLADEVQLAFDPEYRAREVLRSFIDSTAGRILTAPAIGASYRLIHVRFELDSHDQGGWTASEVGRGTNSEEADPPEPVESLLINPESDIPYGLLPLDRLLTIIEGGATFSRRNDLTRLQGPGLHVDQSDRDALEQVDSEIRERTAGLAAAGSRDSLLDAHREISAVLADTEYWSGEVPETDTARQAEMSELTRLLHSLEARIGDLPGEPDAAEPLTEFWRQVVQLESWQPTPDHRSLEATADRVAEHIDRLVPDTGVIEASTLTPDDLVIRFATPVAGSDDGIVTATYSTQRNQWLIDTAIIDPTRRPALRESTVNVYGHQPSVVASHMLVLTGTFTDKVTVGQLVEYLERSRDRSFRAIDATWTTEHPPVSVPAQARIAIERIEVAFTEHPASAPRPAVLDTLIASYQTISTDLHEVLGTAPSNIESAPEMTSLVTSVYQGALDRLAARIRDVPGGDTRLAQLLIDRTLEAAVGTGAERGDATVDAAGSAGRAPEDPGLHAQSNDIKDGHVTANSPTRRDGVDNVDRPAVGSDSRGDQALPRSGSSDDQRIDRAGDGHRPRPDDRAVEGRAQRLGARLPDDGRPDQHRPTPRDRAGPPAESLREDSTRARRTDLGDPGGDRPGSGPVAESAEPQRTGTGAGRADRPVVSGQANAVAGHAGISPPSDERGWPTDPDRPARSRDGGSSRPTGGRDGGRRAASGRSGSARALTPGQLGMFDDLFGEVVVHQPATKKSPTRRRSTASAQPRRTRRKALDPNQQALFDSHGASPVDPTAANPGGSPLPPTSAELRLRRQPNRRPPAPDIADARADANSRPTSRSAEPSDSAETTPSPSTPVSGELDRPQSDAVTPGAVITDHRPDVSSAPKLEEEFTPGLFDPQLVEDSETAAPAQPDSPATDAEISPPTVPQESATSSTPLAPDVPQSSTDPAEITQEESQSPAVAGAGAQLQDSDETSDDDTEDLGDDEDVTNDHPDAVDFVAGTTIWVPSGPRERVRANIAAIQLLDQLDEEDRYATADEQKVIAGYSGWGAVPQVFDRDRPEWDRERAELREMLGAAGWARARATTPNAHYTPPTIAKAMWNALILAGFTDGRVLEPGCGSGNFLAHAPAEAVMVGVELDSTTARVAAALYPSAQIRNEGFEETLVETETFAASIGNVPFGKIRLHDPTHNSSNLTIHNHFILKSLALTGVGGYVAMITSAYTADGEDTRARTLMSDRADLIGALRLPNRAHARVAGTDVVTDVLLFRVREENRAPSENTRRFLTHGKIYVPDPEDPGAEVAMPINRYFADHPENVLGAAIKSTDAYGNEILGIDGPLGDELNELVAQRLTDIVDQARAADLALTATAESTAISEPEMFGAGLVRPVDQSERIAVDTLRWNAERYRIEVYDGHDWAEAAVRGKRKSQEWRALLGLRDVATQLVRAQLDGLAPEHRKALRVELNRRYDNYLSQYGFINRFKWIHPPAVTEQQHRVRLDKAIEKWRILEGSKTKPYRGPVPDDVYEQLSAEAWTPTREPFKKQSHLEGILRNDPTISVVFALENFDDETGRATKAAVFTADVVSAAPKPPERVNTIDDAVAASLNESNGIQISRIAGLLGVTVIEAEQQLVSSALAFRSVEDPDVWIDAPIYLSGNVRSKLAAATRAAESNPQYAVNVKALTAVVPERKTDVDIRLGAVWVDPADYVQFIRDTFDLHAGQNVNVSRVDGSWIIDVPKYGGWDADVEKWGLRPKKTLDQRSRYNFDDPDAERRGIEGSGVAKAPSHIDLLRDLCNSRTITVNKSGVYLAATGGDVIHTRATRMAQNQAKRLNEEFCAWALDRDATRRERLLDRYNDLFNSYVAPQFDGSYLTLPGLGATFVPYDYQRSAVRRICSTPTVLLDHVVGAGKTGTMLMAAMELKRLRLARQPWIVVPNHIIDQVTREANQWYPGARVLSGAAATDSDSRRRLLAQSAAQDWDIVIVPMSAFKRMNVSGQTSAQFIQVQIDTLESGRAHLTDRESIKELEIKLANAKQRLKRALSETSRDAGGFGFEDGGCDYLFVDEAHNFKNLERESNVMELACIPGSQQALDMLLKLSYLRTKRRREAEIAGIPADAYIERVATFATGTPVANSLSELFVMTKYLRPDLLEHSQVEHLDAWGSNFTDTVTRVELNTSGTRLVSRTRVGEFINTGDLIAMTSTFTDVVGRDQIPANLPELDGGEREVVAYEPEQEILDFIQDLGYRADSLDPKRPDLDNLLKISTDGRNVTLDPRAAHLDAPANGGRARIVAQKVLEVHAETKFNTYLDALGEPSPTPGGLQIVFCDRSTPKNTDDWTIYQAIKDELIAGGMEPGSIRFIHDYPSAAAKQVLFDECKNGKVSVILGSTEKMGTGTNIQTRATALHHVDVPWKPADLQQREGRIIRQHNQNAKVKVFCYVAERTFDTIMWQILQRKAHFIEQLKRADRSVRRVKDIENDDLAENAAAIKAIATGDNRHVRKVELDSAVAGLQAEQDQYFAANRSREREISSLERAIPRHGAAIQAIQTAVEHLESLTESQRNSSYVVNGKHFSKRPEASKALMDILRASMAELQRKSLDEALTVATIKGFQIEVRYSTEQSLLYIKPVGLPTPPRAIEREKLYIDAQKTHQMTPEEQAADQARLASGIMSRVENMITELPHALEMRKLDLELDSARLSELQTTQPDGFDRSDELAALYAELDQLERDLRNEATSPEALAARIAHQQRLEAKGRDSGWSLMLNATPGLCRQLGVETPDEIRELMAQRAESAKLKQLAQQADESQLVNSETEGAFVLELVEAAIAPAGAKELAVEYNAESSGTVGIVESSLNSTELGYD
ncbi:DEAD/DEAH box helicase family protein [Nocardia sp. CA-135953]|uniref:DEAD/DEAH box helicase family protein n=1 Tax=Nocardia sp. CA-135953 TaxID=3239978 RepID=UPI003D95E5CB